VVGSGYIQHDVDVELLYLPKGALPGGGDRCIHGDKRLLALAVGPHATFARVSAGTILSGDQFFTEEQTRARSFLFDDMAGVAIDMESAASAYVCAVNETPFIAIRTICSELTGSQEAQFERTLLRVVNNAAPIIAHICKSW